MGYRVAGWCLEAGTAVLALEARTGRANGLASFAFSFDCLGASPRCIKTTIRVYFSSCVPPQDALDSLALTGGKGMLAVVLDAGTWLVLVSLSIAALWQLEV